MKNLIFIGMPAVGKSTVGVVVAKTAGNGIYRYRFIDSEARGTSAQRDYSRCGGRWISCH